MKLFWSLLVTFCGIGLIIFGIIAHNWSAVAGWSAATIYRIGITVK